MKKVSDPAGQKLTDPTGSESLIKLHHILGKNLKDLIDLRES